MSYDTYKPEWNPKDKSSDAKFATHVMTGVNKTKSKKSSQGKKPPRLVADDYIKGILDGDRMLLSRAITIVESNAPKHFPLGQEIIQGILPHAGNSIRVGITGVPGAGKSTFIESLGTELCQKGKKIAVLAVDPTSSLSRGSILGDKTRMENLSKEPNAFIRPSPSGGTLGGVNRKSRETIMLCEAAGYDTVLVETVGVGQSETIVRSMVDFFLYIVLTGAGDDLQGIKKGVMELAEAIVVNKADGDNKPKALIAQAEYNQILHYLRPTTENWETKAFTASAHTGENVPEIWDVVKKYRKIMTANGQIKKRRQEQNLSWIYEMADEDLHAKIEQNKDIIACKKEIREKVMAESLAPTLAAQKLIKVTEKALKEI